MVNRVILIGNLGADPEIKSLESGVSVARLRIATSENYKDKNTNEWKEVTEWLTVTMWRSLADRAEKSLRKGMQIYIEGKLTTRKWTDQEGKERYSTDVVANYLRIVNIDEVKDKITIPFFIKTRDISPDCTVLFGPILLSSVPFTPSP